MKLFIFLTLNLFITSCGFNSDKDPEEETFSISSKPSPKLSDDSDGDLVKNGQELELGRDPYIADLPELEINFQENISISFKYNNMEEDADSNVITMSTGYSRNDPRYKNNLAISNLSINALRVAAKHGRFSSHSSGTIKEDDVYSFHYPNLPASVYQRYSLMYSKYFQDENIDRVSDLSINLKCNALLKENSSFDSIKNLKVSFLYESEEKRSTQLIYSTVIDKHFNKGINENFSIEIDSIPTEFIQNNLFKHGKSLIVRIDDYEIPSLGTTFKEILRSIKNKSIPLVVKTPLKERLFYVSLEKRSRFLNNILETVFNNQFEIKDNEINKIDQFENNLRVFEELFSLKGLHKEGKWFVFTDKISKHHLDYEFKPSNYISLIYATGDELSNQPSDVLSGFKTNIESDIDNKFILGDVNKNSSVNITVKPSKFVFTKRSIKNSSYSGGGCGSGNCVPCHYNGNFRIVEIDKIPYFYDPNLFPNQIEAPNLKNYLKYLFIQIGTKVYNVKTLSDEKKVLLNIVNNDSITIKIFDINKFHSFDDEVINEFDIKFRIDNQLHPVGVQLLTYSGCLAYLVEHVLKTSFESKTPVSTSSKLIDKLRSRAQRLPRYNLKFIEDKDISDMFLFDIQASLINNFN